MKLRKLNLRKPALVTVTSLTIILSLYGNKVVASEKNLASEPAKGVMTTVPEEQTVATEKPTTKKAEPTKKATGTPTTPKAEPTSSTVKTQEAATEESKGSEEKTISEEDLFNEILSAVDGYDDVRDYEYIFDKSKDDKETEKKAETETPKPTEEPKKQDPTSAKNGDNPYLQHDEDGDAFVLVDPNGNFVENPDAPEKYAGETDTKKETESKKESSDGSTKANEEAIASVKEFYGNTEEKVIGYINEEKFEEATEDLRSGIVTGLDFLFYGGKINNFTKKQVDKETINYVVNELNNNISIIDGLSPEWKSDLSALYVEAIDYLDLEEIEKFDEIGKEIKKNNPEEKTSTEEKTKTR